MPEQLSMSVSGSGGNSTHIPVHGVECLDLLRPAMILIISIEVIFPLLSGDALSKECVYIVSDIGEEDIKPAQCALCEVI